jgi:hypothetical protein
MKIFLILLLLQFSFPDSNNSYVSNNAKSFETISDALDYRDKYVFSFQKHNENSHIVDCSIYEITIDTETWKIIQYRLVEGKY